MSTESFDVVLRNGVVVTESSVEVADLAIRASKICRVGDGAAWAATKTIEVRGLYLFPGVIDTHTHTHWGTLPDFASQCAVDSRAAVLGGTTTALVLHRMPPDGFRDAVAVAAKHSYIDFSITPAVTSEDHVAHIGETLDHESLSVKFYLAYRRLPDAEPGDDWNLLTPELFEQCLHAMGTRQGAVACIHAEDAETINSSLRHFPRDVADGLKEWSRANPQSAEATAIRFAAEVARKAGVAIYFVHLSGTEALSALESVRRHQDRVYAETCPHYLFHTTDSDPAVKFSPPVRDRVDQDALWNALANGAIQCVGSDNSTTTVEEKGGSIWEIRRGGPNAGFLLSVVLSEGVNKGRIGPQRAAAVTAGNAARIFGLYPGKGAIRPGADADLVVVDMKKRVTVGAELLGGDLSYTLYDGEQFIGWPVATFLRGQLICWSGELLCRDPRGRKLAGLRTGT